jgi:hypothetical protein
MALDPSYAFYSEGTISVTNGSDIATGNFTAWDPAVLPWDFVFPNDGTAGMSVIQEVLAMDQIRLAKPWSGPTLSDVPYTMVRWARHTDPRLYAVRVSEYLARLKAIPENLAEIGQQVAEDATAATISRQLAEAAQINAETARSQAEAAQTNTQTLRNEAETLRNEAASSAAAAANAPPFDANLATYTPLGAGGVARSIVQVLNDFSHSTAGYAGIDPSGVTSSSAGINAALAAQKAVFFPPGHYKLDAPLMGQAGAIIEGAGYTKGSIATVGRLGWRYADGEW